MCSFLKEDIIFLLATRVILRVTEISYLWKTKWGTLRLNLFSCWLLGFGLGGVFFGGGVCWGLCGLFVVGVVWYVGIFLGGVAF